MHSYSTAVALLASSCSKCQWAASLLECERSFILLRAKCTLSHSLPPRATSLKQRKQSLLWALEPRVVMLGPTCDSAWRPIRSERPDAPVTLGQRLESFQHAIRAEQHLRAVQRTRHSRHPAKRLLVAKLVSGLPCEDISNTDILESLYNNVIRNQLLHLN